MHLVFFLHLFQGRILGNFRPFSVTNERSEKSAHFPGKWADFSLSARAEGGGRRADFIKGPCEGGSLGTGLGCGAAGSKGGQSSY